MEIKRLLFTLIAAVMLHVAYSQEVITGHVIDKETHDPLIGATIFDAEKNKPLTVTDAEGNFRIPNNSELKKIRITYIGYKTLTSRLKAQNSRISWKPR